MLTISPPKSSQTSLCPVALESRPVVKQGERRSQGKLLPAVTPCESPGGWGDPRPGRPQPQPWLRVALPIPPGCTSLHSPAPPPAPERAEPLAPTHARPRPAPPRQCAHPRPAPPPPRPAPARPRASRRGRTDPSTVGTGDDGTSAAPLSRRQPRAPRASGPGGGRAQGTWSAREGGDEAGGGGGGRLAAVEAAPGPSQPLPQPGAPSSGACPVRVPARPHGTAPRVAVLLAPPALCALRRRGQPDPRCVRVGGAGARGARGASGSEWSEGAGGPWQRSSGWEAVRTLGLSSLFFPLCYRRCRAIFLPFWHKM